MLPRDPDVVLKNKRPYAPFDLRRAGARFVMAMGIGTCATLLLPASVGWRVRVGIGWDVGALLLIVFAWLVIGRADAKETADRAGSHDPGRTMVWVIALASSFVSFFSALSLLRKGHADTDAPAALRTVISLSAVLLSWVLTHTVYTLRYAHLYYRRIHAGGLEFPGGKPPRDLDFAYFSFTLGMCFQTSDVAVSSSRIRRTVLIHALLSFVYNTTILALALNIAFGLLS